MQPFKSHIQIPGNAGSWNISSLESNCMYKIILSSLLYIFSAIKLFKITLKTFVLGSFPMEFLYVLENRLFFIISRFILVFLYLNFWMWTPILYSFFSIKLVLDIFSVSIRSLQKQQGLFFSRFIFSSSSRLDATYICAQNEKQAVSHAPYSGPFLMEILNLLMLS